MENIDVGFMSLEQSIERDLLRNRDSLERGRKKLEESKINKLGLVDKLVLKKDVKGYKREISNLVKLKKDLFRLKHMTNNNVYKLPSEIKDKLAELSLFLSEKDINELYAEVNACISKKDSEFSDNINAKFKSTINAAKDADYYKKRIHHYKIDIHNNWVIEEANVFAVAEILNNFVEKKLKNISERVYDYQSKVALADEAETLKGNNTVLQLEKLIKNKQLESSEEIINNFKKIKQTFEKKDLANEANDLLSNLIRRLKAEKIVDFQKVIKILENHKKNYEKTILDSDRFLSKFNFDSALKQAKLIAEKEEELRVKQQYLKTYKNLAYEYERLNNKDSKNIERKKELEAELRKISSLSKANSDELKEAFNEGKHQYLSEKRENQILLDSIEDEKKKLSELDRKIREIAIRELEMSGAFEGRPEYKNGDVYNTMNNDEREKLISKKINEIKNSTKKSPEDRGLESLKEKGLIPSEATVKDLTQQQVEDFRYAYRDSSYDNLDSQKNLENKSYSINIYEKYVKYLATIKDKESALTFKEFAQNQAYISKETNQEEFEDVQEGLKIL